MTDAFNSDTDPRFDKLQDDESPDTVSIAEAYSEGLDYLKKKLYRLIPDISGQFALHRVYRLTAPSTIDGLTFPTGFKVWQEVASQTEVEIFQAILQEWISVNPEYGKYWLPFIQPDPSKRKPIYGHAQALINLKSIEQSQKADQPVELGIDFYPQVPLNDRELHKLSPRAYIPNTEWFSPEVRKLTINDILTLWPEAERELLALIIGRSVVGRSNSITPSGYLVKHTSRMCALILGKDPGLGKSTFFNYLLDSLKWAGYTVETFSKMGSRFNMGPVATADIIYKDDIAKDGLKSFVASENTKIIITGNGMLKVEDKGVNAVNVQPCGTIILNANEFNPRTIYDIDPGTADRIKVLSTYRRSELDRLQVLNSPSAYPEHHIPFLAKQTGVDPKVVMLWLARLCADKFLEVTQPVENGNPLRDQVHYWSYRLRMPLHKNATAQAMSFLMFAYLFELPKVKHKKVRENILNNATPLVQELNWKQMLAIGSRILGSKSGQPILAALKYDFEEHNPTFEFHPYLGAMLLSATHLWNAYLVISAADQSDPDIASLAFDHIKLTTGLPLSKDLVWLNESFQTIFPSMDQVVDIASYLTDAMDTDLPYYEDGLSETVDPAFTGAQVTLNQGYYPVHKSTIQQLMADFYTT